MAHEGNARAAAAMAASACSASACAYSPITSARLEGFLFGVADFPATHSPAMRLLKAGMTYGVRERTRTQTAIVRERVPRPRGLASPGDACSKASPTCLDGFSAACRAT